MFAPLKTESGWSVKTRMLKSPVGKRCLELARLPNHPEDNLTEAEAAALAAALNRWYHGQTPDKKRRASDD